MKMWYVQSSTTHQPIPFQNALFKAKRRAFWYFEKNESVKSDIHLRKFKINFRRCANDNMARHFCQTWFFQDASLFSLKLIFVLIVVVIVVCWFSLFSDWYQNTEFPKIQTRVFIFRDDEYPSVPLFLYTTAHAVGVGGYGGAFKSDVEMVRSTHV